LVFLLCACLLFAFRLSLALELISSTIFNDFLVGSELFSVLRATMWLQVEEVATTDFLLVEKVYVAFSEHPTLSEHQSETLMCFPMVKYA